MASTYGFSRRAAPADLTDEQGAGCVNVDTKVDHRHAHCQERYVCRLLEKTVLDLCRGQHLDLLYRTERPSLEQYLEMVRLKTGVLLGAACESGAIIAGATNKRASARKFGEALGVGFQLRDDYLGAWESPQEMGKAADDLKDGRWSLPVLVGARPEGVGADVPTAIDWMVEEWTRRAHGHLSEAGLPSGWDEMFVELTQALVSRSA